MNFSKFKTLFKAKPFIIKIICKLSANCSFQNAVKSQNVSEKKGSLCFKGNFKLYINEYR